jgi:hypothetical protein
LKIPEFQQLILFTPHKTVDPVPDCRRNIKYPSREVSVCSLSDRSSVGQLNATLDFKAIKGLYPRRPRERFQTVLRLETSFAWSSWLAVVYPRPR